jgi:putative ABC transport system permease protein
MVPNRLPGWIHFTPDPRVLAFAIGIAGVTGLLAGAAPAWSASRMNLVDALKEGGRTSTAGGRRAWFRNALVATEIAMSVLLLAGAGLMIQTFRNLSRVPTGYRTEDITTLQTAAPDDRYPQGEDGVRLVRRIREEFASIPRVISVAAMNNAPLLGSWGRSFTAEGAPLLSLKDAPLINHVVVTPGYFRSIGIPLVEGRDFDENDAKNPLVTILDAGLARHYWPNGSAIGKRVRYGPPEANEPWHTVVGVVGEARNVSLRTMRRQSVYLPHGEFGFSSMAYAVRTAGGLADPAKALRERLVRLDRNIAMSRVLTMKEIVSRNIWQDRFFATIFGFFAAVALLMAVIGLYGVTAYAVSRRTHEMGIRMALGASARAIRRMILVQSGRLVAAGLALGTIAAVFTTRLLASQLFGVGPGDPRTLAGVALLLAAAAIVAGYIPARRATRVDPVLALRDE